MSIVVGDINGPEADIVRKDKLPRERLLLLRDGLIEVLSGYLTQEQLGIIFNRHPEHIGRLIRTSPEGQADQVYAILSGRV